MSIVQQNNEQIARLRSAISEAYAECKSKDATMPSSEIVANLAACIRSIQHGIPEGYIKPTETIDIDKNTTSPMDISNGKWLNVAVPVPDGYIDKTKISHFATGVVTNVTSGTQIKITGIKDDMTGETFNLKGVFACLSPTATTNYISGGGGAPGLTTFYKTADNTDGIGIAVFSSAFSVRANPGMKNNNILSVSGNSFTFSAENSMYGVLAATRWRWFAWG